MNTQLLLFEADVLRAKLQDVDGTPGFVAELEPDEADALGAFREHALSDDEATESASDRTEVRS